ncbi:hypothetical protein [Nocardioides sp.]|uniref:hypothetical protein n=1 Tax=Nocardioides sp. TaxID=35761 RepID=UPI002CE2ED3B|nr:hypothetical protein [Nocardioides sp.]HXH79891.1 hypothetical protein [Nocardioides sp.]
MTHTDDQLGQHEAELHDLLERTVNAVPVPVGLAPSALQHGRRLRTRRRAGLAASFAAGTAAAAVAAALIVPNALGGSVSSIDPAGGPTSATASEPPEPPARVDWPAGWWDMLAPDMVAAVGAILPDDVVVRSSGPLIADTAEGGVALGYIAPRLTGPTGPGTLYLTLLPNVDFLTAPGLPVTTPTTGPAPSLSDADALSCPANLSTRVQCEVLRAPDGTVSGRRSSTTSGLITNLEVVLQRDGGTVYAAAINNLDGGSDGQPGASADEPPLTLDQLEDLVRNDTWVMPAT